MDENQKESLTYSPVDIYNRFGLSRTTLFRWEENGEILPAERDEKGRRIYRQSHIESIARQMRKKIKEEIENSRRYNPDQGIPSLDSQEKLYRIEFSSDKDPLHGLEQLRGLTKQRPLKEKTVRCLVDSALSRKPKDPVRKSIWRVLLESDDGLIK